MKSKILLLSRLTASRFSRIRSLSNKRKLLATSRCNNLNAHRKIPSASAFIFSARSGSSALSTGCSLGGQHKLSAIKSVTAVIQGLQITVTECQQPGEHPALNQLCLPLRFQSILPLCCHDGFYMALIWRRLPSAYHHLRTAGCAPDRHGQSGFQKSCRCCRPSCLCQKIAESSAPIWDLPLATVAHNHHHTLSFVGGDQAITDKLLQGGNVFRMGSPFKSSARSRAQGHRDWRQQADGLHDSRSALGKCAVR